MRVSVLRRIMLKSTSSPIDLWVVSTHQAQGPPQLDAGPPPPAAAALRAPNSAELYGGANLLCPRLPFLALGLTLD